MARGKEALSTANRRLIEAHARIAELEREVADTRAAAHQADLAHDEALRQAKNESVINTAEAVQRLLTDRAATLSNGLTAAWYKAARVAMTEHLTWLFLRGLIDWDRLDGDEAVITFLAAHGDLDTWFALTRKHAHKSNHADRRRERRIPGVRQALQVLDDIHRAKEGDRDLHASREALNSVVDAARDAFVNVELDVLLTETGTVTADATDEERAWHAEVMADIPRLRDAMPPSVKRAAELAVPLR